MVDSPAKGLISDEYEFEDSEAISSGGGGSFKEIVLNQYHKCIIELSKEMTTGGNMTRVIDGRVIEFPVPNQIEISINCITTLDMILNKKKEKHWKEIKNRMMKFYDSQKRILQIRNDSIKEIMNKRMNIEDIQYPVSEKIEHRKRKEKYINSLDVEKWYEHERIKNYRYLFETLGILLEIEHYFEEEKVSF